MHTHTQTRAHILLRFSSCLELQREREHEAVKCTDFVTNLHLVILRDRAHKQSTLRLRRASNPSQMGIYGLVACNHFERRWYLITAQEPIILRREPRLAFGTEMGALVNNRHAPTAITTTTTSPAKIYDLHT